MTAETRKRTSFPFAFLILAAVVAFGLVLGIIRLVQGLGATTNLSDFYPWGLWITFDVFAVPFSAGAFTLAAVVYIFNREKYHNVARLAVLAGFTGYLLVVLVLLMDLGRWDQFYSVLLPYRWNLHSFMFEVSMSITIYFGVLILELASIIFERRGWAPIRLIHSVIPLIAGVGILLSTVHQGSLGALFLLLSHRLSAIWWTPILPILFLTSAVFSGLSVTVLLAIVTLRAMGRPAPIKLLSGLAKVILVVLALYLVLKVGDLVLAGDLGLAFSSGTLSVLFVAEMLVGVIAPLVILASRARNSEQGLLAAVICVLVGLAINRSSIAWFALSPLSEATYTPHWMEFGIAIAAVCAGVLIYGLGVRYVPTLQKAATEAEH